MGCQNIGIKVDVFYGWSLYLLTIHSSLFGVYSKLLYTQYEMSGEAKRRPLKCIVEKLHILTTKFSKID